MSETFDPNIIVTLLSGKAGDLFTITQLMTRAFFILVAGLIIWRITAAYANPKPVRERRKFMASKYQENWRKHQK